MRIEPIHSEANPLLKDIRRACARGTLTDQGLAVAEGPHLLEEAIRSGVALEAVIVTEGRVQDFSIPASARAISVPDGVFRKLSSTEAPQGVISLFRPGAWTFDSMAAGRPLLVLLDGIQDPGNLGAILRTAEAFGATGCVLMKGCVNPYNPKSIRASAGSIFRMPLLYGLEAEQVMAELKARSIPPFAASARGEVEAKDVDFSGNAALIIGSEGRGISEVLLKNSKRVRIPTAGVESLNASIAAAVLLYEAQRQSGGSSRV